MKTPIAKFIQCDCGFSVRETDEDKLVARVREHARSHGMDLTREQILAMAQPEGK
jgi:predicted small metal-binding protein